MTIRDDARQEAEAVLTGIPNVQLLACTLCGVLLWDIEAHYAHAHPETPEPAAEFDRMIEVVKAEARAEERKRLAREIRAEAIGPREGDLAATYIWYAGRRAGLQWAETIVCGQREDT